ncbi:MAG: transglutaminase domain-containing protein [Euryarchaeota archaeon]|nr:transglutaminase domain-containing protein [Euryarchaeota archaeon]
MKHRGTALWVVSIIILSVLSGCIEGEIEQTPSPSSPSSTSLQCEIVDLRVIPKEPTAGDILTILVDVQNTGDAGKYETIVTIGMKILKKEIEIDAKSYKTVEFQEVLDTEGEVEIAAGYLTKTIFVASAEPTTTPTPTTDPPTETPTEEEPSFFYTLDGTFSQTTTYEYTIHLEGEPGNQMYVQTVLIPSISSYHFSQQVLEQEIGYSELPEKTMRKKDESGARYERVEWTDPPEEVVVTRTVKCKTTVGYSPFITQSKYPLETQSLPHLNPEPSIQSDDPEIVRQAEEIVEGAESAMDAAVKILNWVRYNIQYTCSKHLKVCEGVLFADAKKTLEHKKGNCVNFAHLAIALLRAAGIPAMRSGGYVADSEYESAACHAWIVVYIPEEGFVEFESSYWMPRSQLVPETIFMPQHICYGDVGVSNANFSELHRSTQEITSLPEKKTYVSETINKNDIVSFFAYIEKSSRDYTVSFTADAPQGWKVFFSNDTLNIDSENYISKELLITIIPPPDAKSGDEAEIIVTADDGTRQDEIVISVAVE